MENVTKALAGAALIYGQPLDADQLRAYLAVFAMSGMADERLARGVLAACKVCKFFPRPADVIENSPPAFIPANRLPAADDVVMTAGDTALAVAMLPVLRQWLSKVISLESFLAQLRWEAKKAGVESSIDWDEFGDDAPWCTKAGRA
jgi:hypothetical protein